MANLPRTQRAVMQLLVGGRSHAYAIKLQLASRLGHSSVYAALAAAETKGYVVAEWEHPAARPPGSGPPRKYYELSAEGRAALQAADRADANRARRAASAPPLGEASS